MFQVQWINRTHKSFKKIKKNALGCMNVILLHGSRRYVSAIHVSIIRVLRTRIQRTHYNFKCISILATLKMATWVAETCRWLLCNIIAFMHPSAFVGLLRNFLYPLYTLLFSILGVRMLLNFYVRLSMSRTPWYFYAFGIMFKNFLPVFIPWIRGP